MVSRGLHPHSRETLATYAKGFDAKVVEVGLRDGLTDRAEFENHIDQDVAAVFVQNPNFLGGIEDLEALAAAAHESGALAIASVDPMTLGILRPPGDAGIDVAVGEGQPLGGRLDYGGPSFGFFCATEEHLRRMPGRISAARPPTPTDAAVSSSRCRRVSSTSAARRRPTTSAPRRR